MNVSEKLVQFMEVILPSLSIFREIQKYYTPTIPYKSHLLLYVEIMEQNIIKIKNYDL